MAHLADLSLLFEIFDTAQDVTYEARFELATGSGTLAPSEEGGYSPGGEYADIVPGSYPLVFTPSELGPQQLAFTLRDSNGQEIREEIDFNVVENIRVISIFLGEDDTIELQLGDEVVPDITFDPPNATDQGFTLVSSDPEVVLIDENNVCIAVGPGTAVVTVTSTSNPEATDTVTVTVTEPDRIPVTSIVVSQQDPEAQGAVRQLIATVLPEDATDPGVTWASSDTEIATVDENGLLTGLAAGTVTITATSVSDPEVNDTISVEITGGSLQSGNDITVFELPGQNGSEIDTEAHTITVNVTDGTELEVAPSALSISGGATIAPGIADLQDFSAAVSYTVTAGDGTSQVWTVNVTVSPPVGSASNDITDFSLAGQVAPFAIDATAHTITVTVPDGTALNVAPEVLVISDNATIAPPIDEVQDFSAPVAYTVTAENGEQQLWTVNTTVLPPGGDTANDITAFELPGQNTAAIDGTAHTVTVNVPDGTVLEAVVPAVLTVSEGATVDPLISVARDFNAAVTYTVTAANGDEQAWTVNTTVAVGDNQPPVAVDDIGVVGLGETVRIDVLANDTDVDTPNAELLIAGVVGVQPENAGSFTQEGREFVFTSSGDYTGDATFGYTVNDGNTGNDATATVTVNITLNEVLVTGITLSETTMSLDVGQSEQLTATVVPANATNANVDWSSSDETAATVSTTGEVTGIAPGSALITASSNDGSNVTQTVDVTVNTVVVPNEPPLAVDDITSVESGESVTIDVLANDTDSDTPNSELIVAGITGVQPANAGSFTQNGREFVFTSSGDYEGEATFGYTVNDGNPGNDDFGQVTITIFTGASAENDIIAFAIPGQTGQSVIDANGHTVAITVPDGTPLNVLPSTFTISPNATSNPAIDQMQDFNNAVDYTITAENDAIQVWTVNVTVSPPVGSAENDITDFTIAGQTGQSVIDNASHTVTVEVPFGTNLNTSPSSFSASPAATVNPPGTSQQDFSTEVQYNVTAENNDVQLWTVTVNEEADSREDENDITAFAIIGQTGQAVIDNALHTVTVEVPFGTNLNTVPIAFAVSSGATVNPAGTSQQDFASPVQYDVTAENNDVQSWTVTVNVGADTRSGANNITAFGITGQTGQALIDNAAHTVTVEVPFGTNLNTSPSSFSVSPAATVNPVGTSQQDFSSAVQYTVTAENTDTQVWTVTVNVGVDTRSGANDITSFAINGQSGQSVIDNVAHTVTVEVPFGTNLNTTPIAFAISDNATVNPMGTSQQDFFSPVDYVVTAENGNPQTWRVTVNVEADTRSGENDITRFTLSPTSGDSALDPLSTIPLR